MHLYDLELVAKQSKVCPSEGQSKDSEGESPPPAQSNNYFYPTPDLLLVALSCCKSDGAFTVSTLLLALR